MPQSSIKGLDRLQRKLKTLEEFQRKLKPPMEESVSLVHDYIATLPRKAAGAFTALATDKQKRAYWARVRSGKANHLEGSGYRRDGTGKAWTELVETTPNGVHGEVGNVNDSQIWAQSREHQQPFHKASGWRTVEDAIEKNTDKIQQKFDKVVERELGK